MKRFIFIFTILICVLLLCSCSTSSVPKDSQLIEDLSAQDQFVFGGTVSDIEIIKRLTDEENKTDTVYVTATIDHPNHTAKISFVMEYVLYNNGWLMETIDLYNGSESKYEIIPNAPPTDKEIFDQVVLRSTNISSHNSHGFPSGNKLGALVVDYLPLSFFEEGTYEYEIAPSSILEQFYDTTIVIHRKFDYVDVTETAQINLFFDELNDKWHLSQYNITNLDADWHIDGTWSSTNHGEHHNIVIDPYPQCYEFTDYSSVTDLILSPAVKHYYVFNYSWEGISGTFNMIPPSSELIHYGSASEEKGNKEILFCVTPNGVYYDFFNILGYSEMEHSQ